MPRGGPPPGGVTRRNRTRVWNQGTESTDCVFHNAFGNTHIAIDDLVAEGDKIAVRLIMSKAGRNKSLVTLPFEN